MRERTRLGMALAAALLAIGAACSTASGKGDSGNAGASAGGSRAAGATAGALAGHAGTVSTGKGGDGARGGRDVGAGRGGASEPTAGRPAEGGAPTAGQSAGALGPYPFTPSPVTRGGTMTFTNIGAPGWWPRRLDRPRGDPACDYKDGSDTWGGHCCMTRHETQSEALSPFDEEMTLILKAIDVKQLAIYGASATGGDFERVTAWDRRSGGENLWFTQKGNGSAAFPGDLTRNDCVGYVMQEPMFECGDGSDYYCPDDPGVLHRGFAGSKLVVFLGSMNLADADVAKCEGTGRGHPGPWVAFVASELVRDGGRKWNGLCNCYSRTGSVGDGCGEINVFEVVMDGNEFSNREFASTGVRSFQHGHLGGAVCGAGCERSDFPPDVEVVDACSGSGYARGPVLVGGGETDGCPVWRRPDGDRYFFILLDRVTRTIQVGVVHPASIPPALAPILPQMPARLTRSAIDAAIALRLPE